MKDKWNREINYMRLSVTDQCNLQCCYCMPKDGITALNKDEFLSCEEMKKIIMAGVELGINRIKITGGEPLLRENIIKIIEIIKKISGIQQVTLTTNGVLLKKYACDLKACGINCINVNLPALTRDKYLSITGRDQFYSVLEGIRTAKNLELPVKINCVSSEAMTRDEIYGYGMIAKQYPIDVRFIEMMPVGMGKKFSANSNEEILEQINQLFGEGLKIEEGKGNGPAIYYGFEGFQGKIGLISAISRKFCHECNRIRLSADGYLKLCLDFNYGVSLKEVLQRGTEGDLKCIMEQAIYDKPQKHLFLLRHQEQEESKEMVRIGG